MKGERTRTACLVILTIITVALVLRLLSPLLIPFMIALMISFLLSPLVEMLAKYRIPRIFTLLAVYILGFGIFGRLAELLVSNVVAFAQDLPSYQTKFVALVEQYAPDQPFVDVALENITDFFFNLPIASFANSAVNSSVAFLSNTFLVLLFVTYLCLSFASFPKKVRHAFPGNRGEHITKVMSHINTDIRKYINIHSLISLATGITVGVICWSFSVPFAFLWGALAFLLNYIPTLGSILAAIPPIVAAAVTLGISQAIWVGLLILGAQVLWGNIVEPKVAGDSLGISPLAILISLVFWTFLWGIVGAILAVPIASIIKISCMNIKGLKPIAALMSDK